MSILHQEVVVFIYLIVSVDISVLPLVIGDTHPLKLCCQVDELPPLLSLLVVLFGVVGERIQILIGHCSKKKTQRNASNHRQKGTWV